MDAMATSSSPTRSSPSRSPLGSSPTRSPPTFDSDRWIRDDLRTMRERVPGHTPPVVDQHGFEMHVHSAVANRFVDKLHGVRMPQSWEQAPRAATNSELREQRAASMRPHASYDVDGDGFVGQHDYAISKRHDVAASGMLSGGQRDSAIADACHQLGSALTSDEIGGNARARRILTSLREEPELTDTTRREQRLRVGGMTVRTLKQKSSHQLRQCLGEIPTGIPEPPKHTEAGGGSPPGFTRTMLLAQRRMERCIAEEESLGRFHRSVAVGA